MRNDESFSFLFENEEDFSHFSLRSPNEQNMFFDQKIELFRTSNQATSPEMDDHISAYTLSSMTFHYNFYFIFFLPLSRFNLDNLCAARSTRRHDTGVNWVVRNEEWSWNFHYHIFLVALSFLNAPLSLSAGLVEGTMLLRADPKLYYHCHECRPSTMQPRGGEEALESNEQNVLFPLGNINWGSTPSPSAPLWKKSRAAKL